MAGKKKNTINSRDLAIKAKNYLKKIEIRPVSEGEVGNLKKLFKKDKNILWRYMQKQEL